MSTDPTTTAAVLRVGRKVGRTVYVQRGPEPSDEDPLIGVMDDPQLAAAVVLAFNEHYGPLDRGYLLGLST